MVRRCIDSKVLVAPGPDKPCNGPDHIVHYTVTHQTQQCKNWQLTNRVEIINMYYVDKFIFSINTKR